MQQEVVRSMQTLHHMHNPGKAPVEIPLSIFEFAKKEVTYFNKVANIGRPPHMGNTNVAVDPDDNVLTIVNKKMLLTLRGQKINGTAACTMTKESAETLQLWFVREGAPLVRAGIVRLNMNSNGFSIEKFPPPEEQAQRTEFARVLLQESNLTLQEFAASLEPSKKRQRPDVDLSQAGGEGSQSARPSSHVGGMSVSGTPLVDANSLANANALGLLATGSVVSNWPPAAMFPASAGGQQQGHFLLPGARPPPPPLRLPGVAAPHGVAAFQGAGLSQGGAEAIANSPPTGYNFAMPVWSGEVPR